jgi:3-hydroxyisobutyrate dehydrogenase-like beta-hydroxyacid dehydrogenase
MVHLWNRTASTADRVGVGTVHRSPGEAAGSSPVVLSALTGSEAVRAVYFGDEGALSAGGERVFVDLTTTGTDVHVELAQACAAEGAGFVEAPVLGSLPAAQSGSLVLLTGGEEAPIERARPVLEDLGEVRRVGPVGAGVRLKLVANSFLAVTHGAAAELLAAAEASGLDGADVWPVLVRFVPYLDVRRQGYLDDRHEPVLFRTADMVKDIDLALELFGHAGSPTPVTEVAGEVFARAAHADGELDMSAVTRVFRSR